MDSVSVDLFSMPQVKFEGKTYNTIALCVDRESGWIVATPHRNEGLTSDKVAKAMYAHWQMFGVPSRVTSDRGPHFTGTWWRTMCAHLGIRSAYAQAYHHQANGRAKVAGQQVMRVLRKLIADKDITGAITWVELLPRALRHIHDMPGEAGLSPYEIVFGRQRPLQGLAYRPEREAEDATQWFTKMAAIDEKISIVANEEHAKRMESINKRRREPPQFKIGDKVWYHPERRINWPHCGKFPVR